MKKAFCRLSAIAACAICALSVPVAAFAEPLAPDAVTTTEIVADAEDLAAAMAEDATEELADFAAAVMADDDLADTADADQAAEVDEELANLAAEVMAATPEDRAANQKSSKNTLRIVLSIAAIVAGAALIFFVMFGKKLFTDNEEQ